MSRENLRRLFDSSKQYVVSTNSALPALDGSQLYNVKPPSERFAFTKSGSDHIMWNMDGTMATVMHSLNCYPIVTVWDNNGLQVFPNITLLSSMTFTMDFQYAVQIDPEEPWYCIISYGGVYGSASPSGGGGSSQGGGGSSSSQDESSSSGSSSDSDVPLWNRDVIITVTEYDSSERIISTYNLYKRVVNTVMTPEEEALNDTNSHPTQPRFYTANCMGYDVGLIPEDVLCSYGTRELRLLDDGNSLQWFLYIPYDYHDSSEGISSGPGGVNALVQIQFVLGTQVIGYPYGNDETYLEHIFGMEGPADSPSYSLASYFMITIALNEQGNTPPTRRTLIPPPIIGNTDPDENTEGTPGQTYYNESDDKVFLCAKMATGETPSEILYVWKEIGATQESSGSGGGAWGEITGTLSSQTDLANALAAKADLQNGKVQLSELPKASSTSVEGVVTYNSAFGITGIGTNGNSLAIVTPNNGEIDLKISGYKPITPSNINYAVRSVLPNVTVIPSATTAYTLLDASATTNSHSCKYRHAPTSAPTYTLPDVTDDTVDHEITLDVDCSEVTSLVFVDEDGEILLLQDDIEINYGDRWRFMCSYEYGIWMIFPMQLRNAVLIPDTPISVTGTVNTALSTFSMPVVSSDAEIVTWSNATGLPAGLTLDTAGLLTGTPTESGTFSCTAKAKSKYAPSLVVSFTVTIS